jgi:putative transcriptional regulator
MMKRCLLGARCGPIGGFDVQNGVVSSHDAPIPGSCKGRLLVATPPLEDPNFDRTVVYVLEHTDDGAVGVVLNRPSDDGPPDSLSRWEDWMSGPPVLFDGGPVEIDALIALARLDGPADDAWTSVVGDLGSVDLGLDPALVADAVVQLRVFRGYSGWGPQQLDDELTEGAWMVLPAESDDVFTPEPDGLWRRVLRRQGGRLAWVANAPDDLSSN